MKSTSKIFFALSVLLFVSTSSFAQNDDYNEKEKHIYDSLTSHYFVEKVWDSVIDIGKESIYKGYDFYMLRLRMGMAYGFMTNYRSAEKQYKKALEFVPGDIEAGVLNYYAAINGGRKHVAYSDFLKYNEAQVKEIKNKTSEDIKEESKDDLYAIETPILDRLYFSYGYSFTKNTSQLADIFPKHAGTLYSQGNIRENQSYANLSLGGHLSTMLEWDFSYNRNDILGVQLVQPSIKDYLKQETDIRQNELFAGLNYFAGNGWNIKATGQLLFYKANMFSVKDSIGYSLPSLGEVIEVDSILSQTDHFVFNESTKSNNDYVFGLSVNRKIGLVDFSVFGTYAKIQDKNPFQIGGELVLLPSGNYSLYLSNRLFYYKDSQSEKYIYKVGAGARITQKLNFDATATFGDLQFTNEPNLPVVYNWSDKTSFKGDLVFTYNISKDVYLSLRYQITQLQSTYVSHTFNDLVQSTAYPNHYYKTYKQEEFLYKYNQHFVILGLTWLL